MTEKPIPRALYCCATSGCCEDVSWPAEALWWSENRQDWFCTYCWVGYPGLAKESIGESLEAYLQRREAS